ncbi:MAG: hypothetical protein ACRDGN_06790 [bacterium]
MTATRLIVTTAAYVWVAPNFMSVALTGKVMAQVSLALATAPAPGPASAPGGKNFHWGARSPDRDRATP